MPPTPLPLPFGLNLDEHNPVDHWITAGLPMLRYSTRKLLIPLDLANAWLRARFLVSRRLPSNVRLRGATGAGQPPLPV
jgi:hypothetical protein